MGNSLLKYNLKGERYASVYVIGVAPKIDSNTRWYCRCDCGREFIRYSQSLRRGSVRNCGRCKDYKEKLELRKDLLTTPLEPTDFNEIAPMCSTFGCNRKLSLVEQMAGGLCTHHNYERQLKNKQNIFQ